MTMKKDTIEIKGMSGLDSKEKLIISEIRSLINFKNLKPGEKLPSERLLAEKLNVKRGSIRNDRKIF